MMRRMVVVTLGALLAWTGQAVAQPFPGPPGLGGGGPDADAGMLLPVIIRSVGLTDAQFGKVRTIMEAHRPQLQAIAGELRHAQRTLTEALVASTLPDLEPTIAQITELRGRLMREGLTAAVEVRGVLTPDQLRRASEIGRKMIALRSEMESLLGDPSAPPPLPTP
jgi:Spy/CpxP family protein refolding chaperone